MDLQKIDFLSSPISLYFNNRRTHTSKISGILVIFFLLSCISYSSILLYNLINHINVISLIYKKFEWEAGHYEMNSTSLFHFFQIFSSENGSYFGKFNSTFIRIYLTYAHNNLEQTQLDNIDHWVFNECREGIDNKDINKDLFQNISNFTDSACIRYYYNSKNKEYFSVGDDGFKWPYLEHGTSQKDNIFLTAKIEKCRNDSIITTLLGNCSSDESIEEYINKYFGFYMYLLDNSVDPTNYRNPFQHYFQIISSELGNSLTFVENYIHFSPVRVRTKVGQLFGNYNDINSFFFDSRRKGTVESDNRILLTYYYLMQNNISIYERIYTGYLDILSSIGGTIQLFFYFFFIINFIFNKYIIIMDTNHFFYKIENFSNEQNKKESKSQNKNIDILKNIKKDFIAKNYNKKKLKRPLNSLNLSYKNPLDTETNDNQSEKKENSSKHLNVQLKTENFIINSKNSQVTKNYTFQESSSNLSNESFDYSNIKMKELNFLNKKCDTLNTIKEKNWNSNLNKGSNLEASFLNSKINKKISKADINNSNLNRKSFLFSNNSNYILNNKNYTLKFRPSFKMSNLEEILKNKKINKNILIKSKYFENKFSFLYFLFCSNKRKEEFQNLYSLVLFRKKILSENFIFHQYIINLLIGKKCGIGPKEIKYLV